MYRPLNVHRVHGRPSLCRDAFIVFHHQYALIVAQHRVAIRIKQMLQFIASKWREMSAPSAHEYLQVTNRQSHLSQFSTHRRRQRLPDDGLAVTFIFKYQMHPIFISFVHVHAVWLRGEPQHRQFYSIAPGVERSFIFANSSECVFVCFDAHTYARVPGSRDRNGCNSSAITAQIKRISVLLLFFKVISLCFCVGASDSVWMATTKAKTQPNEKRTNGRGKLSAVIRCCHQQ